MNNLNYDLIKSQLYQLENDFNAKMDEIKKGMNIEEEKKIPDKLDITYEKNCKNNYKWKCEGYNISTPQKLIADKVNEIIDYLKSKGE